MKNDVFFKLPSRSIFSQNKTNTLSFKLGKWIPVNSLIMSPGDEAQVDITQLTRFAPMLTPVMGRFRGRIVSAFIPYRLLNVNYEDINIANNPVGSSFPQISLNQAYSVANVGSLLDYLRYPVYADLYKIIVTALSSDTSYLIENGDSIDVKFDNFAAQTSALLQGQLLYLAFEYRDVEYEYTDTGATTLLGLQGFIYNKYGEFYTSLDDFLNIHREHTISSIYTEYYSYIFGTIIAGVVSSYTNSYPDILLRAYWRFIADWCVNSNITDVETLLSTVLPASGFPVQTKYLHPSSALYQDDFFTSLMPNAQAGSAVPIPTSGSIQDLANATALQRVLIRAMYTGKRYIDYVKAFFGVNSSDTRLQRCEIIGSSDFRISISDIAQTSQSDLDSTLGGFSGRAISYDKYPQFHYRAEEHGIIMTFVVVKPYASYTDAISPILTITNTKELLIPDMQAVGNEPVATSLVTGNAKDTQTLGFARPYWQYIDDTSEVHGEFKTTLEEWHLGRRFDSRPALNEQFISISEADDLDRIFAVQANENIYAMFNFDIDVSRPLSRTIDFKL